MDAFDDGLLAVPFELVVLGDLSFLEGVGSRLRTSTEPKVPDPVITGSGTLGPSVSWSGARDSLLWRRRLSVGACPQITLSVSVVVFGSEAVVLGRALKEAFIAVLIVPKLETMSGCVGNSG